MEYISQKVAAYGQFVLVLKILVKTSRKLFMIHFLFPFVLND